MLDVLAELHQGFTVTGESEERSKTGAPVSTRKRWLRTETALAFAGVLIAVGFVLPWFETASGDGRLSGIEFALNGGVWLALVAIPALGALTALLGLLGWRPSRYAGIATVIIVLVAVAVALATHWPWLYTAGVVAGIAVISLGILKRGTKATPIVGVAILVGTAVAVWLLGRDPLLPDSEHAGSLFGMPLPAAIPLLALSVATALSALALIVTGLRKRGRERALLIAGASVALFSAYAAALDVFGAELASSSIGAWMTAVGLFSMLGVLLTTRPRAASKSAAADRDKTVAAKTDVPAEKPATPKKKADAKTTKKPAASKKAEEPEKETASKSSADAEKAAKIKKLKKLKLLRAKELAAAKEAKDAEEEEKATAKAGEALASEPEPVFAGDLSAPPPKDEDRDALMKRVGVKKPPPPSDSELEAMLAALKSRSDDED